MPYCVPLIPIHSKWKGKKVSIKLMNVAFSPECSENCGYFIDFF